MGNVIPIGNVITGQDIGGVVVSEALGSPAVGSSTAVHAAVLDNSLAAVTTSVHGAVTDTGTAQVVTTAITNPGFPAAITATAGGTAGDVAAISVTIKGTDTADASQTETLPAFTVNTPGTVTGTLLFKTVTEIDIPAHDGTGATTAIGNAAVAGSTQTITTGITSPAVPRNITATPGGTTGNVTAVQCTIHGTDIEGVAISETLPAFSAGAGTAVVGSKAFATVTSIEQPVNGVAVTVAYGTGAKLGLLERLSRNKVLNVFLAGVKDSMSGMTYDATNVSGNTVTLTSSLNGSAVIVDHY